MKKPIPKRGIEITKDPSLDSLKILVFSEDAREFIEKEARWFGNLYPEHSTKVCIYHLHVYMEAYDMDEVKAYLEAQGNQR